MAKRFHHGRTRRKEPSASGNSRKMMPFSIFMVSTLAHRQMAANVRRKRNNLEGESGMPDEANKSVTRRLRVLSIALLFVTCAESRAADQSTDWQPSMQAGAWNFWFSPGMPEHPARTAEGWEFSFPRYEGPLPCRAPIAPDCPRVEYLTTPAVGLVLGRTVTMTIAISGSPEFRYMLEASNTCDTPASVRFLIQRRGDDLTKEFYRWWSNPSAIILAEGQHTMTVPLTPDQWSSVFGRKGQATKGEFVAALREAERIGITFGGGCFFGHGVNVSGSDATFTMKDFAIRP
jgi:hypothetical protein